MSGLSVPPRIETHQRRWFVFGIYAVVLGLLAVPILSVVVPPLVDYPNHLARMHILAAYADSPELRANYLVAWKVAPYLAMDVIIPELSHFMSIYTAGRLFLYACLLLFVVGTAAVHAALFRRLSLWPAASGLFGYGLAFNYGFVNYLFGIGVWLLAFAGWIVLSRGAVRWRIVGGSLLSLLVFFSHFFAFFGYMLCVGAYELGIWLAAPDRGLGALARRGAAAFCPFVVPLVICAAVSRGQSGGVTLYATPYGWMIAMLSPVLFPAVRLNLAILVLILIIPARRGVLGRLHLAREMRLPLAALGVTALAMPNVLFGVWGVDYRLPMVCLFLLIAGCSWRDVPARPALRLAGFMVALLAVNMGLIVWAWRPVGQQFDAFRVASRAIPAGARVIAFRDDTGIDPSLLHEPAAVYDHLAALAVIERDVYLPFLFKHPMMPVEAVPKLRAIDTPTGQPIGLAELFAGADLVRGPAMLGSPSHSGMRNYWGDWPRHYDYAVEFKFGAQPALPDRLELVTPGRMFNIYRIKP